MKKYILNLFQSRNNISFEKLFLMFGSMFFLYIWLITTLTTFNLYSNSIALFIDWIALITSIFYLIKNRINLYSEDYIAILLVLFFGIVSCTFFHHSLYGVRDEGVYANAGIGLVNKQTLFIREFINFPGWTKQNDYYIPQFPFATMSLISSNYLIFKESGIYLTNLLPIIIGGLSLFFVCQGIIKNRYAILILYFTFYPVIWFSRRTSSELMFFCAIWFSCLLLKKVLNSDFKYIYSLILLASVLPLIRIDGLMYFGILIFLILFVVKTVILNIKYILFFLISITTFAYYYLFLGNNYLSSIVNLLNGHQLTTISNSGQLYYGANLLGQNIIPYIYEVISKYNLSIYIFSVFACLMALIANLYKNKFNDKKQIFFILMILINLPTFYYLTNFSISHDQPWFLRRYVYSVIPISVICLVYLIELSKVLSKIIIGILIIINLYISYPILYFREYIEMKSEVDKIALNFSQNNTIVLIDTNATDWYRITTELYFRKGIMAYYIDEKNPIDYLIKNIDKNKKIFLIIGSDFDFSLLAGFTINKIKSENIAYSSLIPTTDLLHMKNKPNNEILNFDYQYIKSIIEVPKKTILVSNEIGYYEILQ